MFLARRYFKYFDWLSFALILILSCIGVLFVYSATYRPEIPVSAFCKKQFLGVGLGILVYCICSAMDYRVLLQWGYLIYTIVIALLIFTIIKGSIGMGAQRWVSVGLFKFQPSELAKVLFPVFAITYLYNHKESFSFRISEYIPLLAMLGISCLLIIKQPDLGTGIIVMITGLVMLWLAGLPKKFFYYGLAFLFVTAPLSWHMLKPYQKKRVLVFLGQGSQKKERYQIEQSKIAIGSGGVFGKGFLKGTQNKLLFLPESRTDFIFSVICEETGLVGACVVILLYLILFMRLFHIILSIDQTIIQIFAFGLIAHTMISVIVNIGMVTDMLPVVGIPLPFISYGLSNLLITYASLGWFNTISMYHAHVDPSLRTEMSMRHNYKLWS